VSLRARLLAGMVVLVAAGLSVAAVATYEEQRSFLLTRVHQQVLSATGPISAELRLGHGQIPGFRGRGPFQRFFGGHNLSGPRPLAVLPPGTFGALRSPTGKVLQRRTFSYDGSVGPNPTLPKNIPLSRQGGSPHLFTISSSGSNGTSYVAVALAVGRDTAIVAVPLHDTDQTLHRLIVVEGLVGAGVILALILLGWFVIRVGLRPLERIGRVASEIAGGDLSRRVSTEDPRTEVGRLGLSLNEMLAQIEEAFRDRSESEDRLRHFLADASHELRTPLASIRGYAELFRLGAADDPATLERAMARIEAEAARMGILVEDLLLLAQLDQIPEARRVPVDLRELAEHAADDTRVVAPGRTVTLEADGAVRVLGDPDRIRQLLANLLRNAVIHTPGDSPIDLRLTREPAWAVLEVRDHGPGLPPDAADMVFERFWRTEGGRSRGRGGAGLGLAIVQAIVGAHGGQVQAENAPGGGALFRVKLPLVGPTAQAPDLGAEGLSAKSQPSHGRHSAESPTFSSR
jgi:two-component system, OmpR family, sensor kinase